MGMTIYELIKELKSSFPEDAVVMRFKVKAKLKYSTRTLEGPNGVFQIEVKSDQQKEV
jgi:hypothetical protein